MSVNDYKIDDIKKILSKIENLKERKHYEKVKDIIYKENPNIETTKKSSGTLMFFHNLNQSTYKKLDIFFTKLENDKINTISNTISESNEKTLSDMPDNNLSEPKIKLSNAEKKIIKKKEYHKQISQHSDDVYISDDDIFLGKN
jgi:hypothetical protein